MTVNFLNVCFHTGDKFFGFVGVELEDACHFDFHQSEDVIFGHFTDESGVIGSETVVNMFTGGIHIFGLLKLFVLIDAFFDEDFLQRGKMQIFPYFIAADFQLLPQ